MKALRFAVLLVFAGAVVTPAQSPSAASAQPAVAKKAWFIRLILPRSTFYKDMTPEEGRQMEEHFVYWKDLFEKGVCLFGGPVLDPKGGYGVMALTATTEDEARAIAAADPSVKSGMNKIEVAEMQIVFLAHPSSSGSGK